MFYNNPYGGYPQQMSVLRVNGENGARALRLMPNSSALALDINAPIVWLCQTDGAGYNTVMPYKIEPIKQTPQESLEDRIKRLEDRYESYLRSNAKQPTESDHATVEYIPNGAESTSGG